MFTRLRWFLYGVVVTVVATAMIIKRARAMRERLDAEGVSRIAASYGADAIEAAGRALQRSARPTVVAVPDSEPVPSTDSATTA